ncbi:helix-turn-helix domain-containing protein [Sansalvadorimonas verongulae]|uniref:helix-turn-helix domain-containing protein n=1 Tax=Sansalvadorimonas verongulae TaxID=2172824 RepID=UPI0012BBB00A|nr:RodZ family helix-turn-helix domain-containing protein [Sansalvadorimonas verongulae]MTI12980.1 helix-turn-helix domain-containing protein [Sansalvadorimonas verongulae]
MAEENTQISEGPEDKFLRAGQALAEARMNKGLSLEDVSARLKISPPYLQALENCEYDQLPGTAFVRGYLRSYARLVELDENHILALYGETVQADEQVARLLREKSLDHHGVPGGKWLATVSLVLLAAFVAGSVYWWNNQAVSDTPAPVNVAVPVSTSDLTEKNTSEKLAEATESAAEVSALVAEPANQPVEQVKPVAEPEVAVAVVASSVETAKPVSAVTAPVQDVLVVRFRDKCWVEVQDAEGKVLFADLKPANSELTLTGDGPLSIKFGNVDAVTEIVFNGKPVTQEIPASSRGIGRLTLG